MVVASRVHVTLYGPVRFKWSGPTSVKSLNLHFLFQEVVLCIMDFGIRFCEMNACAQFVRRRLFRTTRGKNQRKQLLRTDCKLSKSKSTFFTPAGWLQVMEIKIHTFCSSRLTASNGNRNPIGPSRHPLGYRVVRNKRLRTIRAQAFISQNPVLLSQVRTAARLLTGQRLHSYLPQLHACKLSDCCQGGSCTDT